MFYFMNSNQGEYPQEKFHGFWGDSTTDWQNLTEIIRHCLARV